MLKMIRSPRLNR